MINERQVFDLFHSALDVQPRPGAFDRLQSALTRNPVRPERRPRLVIPFPRTGLRVAAGIAAVVLAAIVIGSFAYIHAVTRPHTVTPPINSASPSPTPLSQSLNVDPATPVILFVDPANNQIDAMTWDGQSAGKLTVIPNPAQPVCKTTANTESCSPLPQGGGAPPLNGPESSNPAGTLFVAFPYFYDRSGRVVAELKGGPYADPAVGIYFVGTWADDGLHYCQVVPIFGGTSAVTGTLQVTTPGGSSRDVVQVGRQAPGENTLTVTTCSELADRAVVIQADPNSGPNGNPPLQYWVVQLSTGRILWTHDLRGTNTTHVIASRDGHYVAELESNGSSTIYGPSGSVVGHLTGSIQNFSWDGSLAVVYKPGGVACHCSYGPVSLIRWSTGTVIWSGPADQVLYASQSEPGGGSLAIETQPGNLAPHQETYPLVLLVVSASGEVLGEREAGSIFPG